LSKHRLATCNFIDNPGDLFLSELTMSMKMPITYAKPKVTAAKLLFTSYKLYAYTHTLDTK